MAAPRRPSNQGLVIQTSQGVYDLSELYAAATPTPRGLMETQNVPGRNSPLRTPTRVDLSYEMAGFLDSTGGQGRAVRAAAIAAETIGLVQYQTDNNHWWHSNLLIPTRADEDGDLLRFAWTMPSDGSPWSHGRLLDGTIRTNQAVTGVPAGALGLVVILAQGNLTALRWALTVSGTEYLIDISSPAPQIHVAKLETAANVEVPAGSDGNFKVTTTPSNAMNYEILVGYGLPCFEVN